MHYREASLEDIPSLVKLFSAVAANEGGIAREPEEITSGYVESFVRKSLENGLIIVGEHPENRSELIAGIHASKPGIHVFDHLLTNLTIVVHPEWQRKRIGRTLFTIFLEEITRHRPDVGKVELMVRESNVRAISFYQALGFRIEGRLEMRIRTRSRQYEADIPMGWQNPNYEF